MKKLPKNYYLAEDVCEVARDLLGKELFTFSEGKTTSGIIVETEAYSYRERACHAYGNRRTSRTETLFLEGSISYVYLCYGMYNLFNVVTNADGVAEAVLVRALEPALSVDQMVRRRGHRESSRALTSGPGKLTIALGIDSTFNKEDLTGNRVWIEDAGMVIDTNAIVATERVGVDYAGDDARLPWRYYIKGNKWVSKQ